MYGCLDKVQGNLLIIGNRDYFNCFFKKVNKNSEKYLNYCFEMNAYLSIVKIIVLCSNYYIWPR